MLRKATGKRTATREIEDSVVVVTGASIRNDFVMVADGEIQSGSYNAFYG